MRRAAAATLFLASWLGWSFPAHAVVESCTGVNNGVPCVGPCILSGTCMAQMCVGTVRPDTTPCSSGNHCTTDDFCQSGVCQPGPTQISCPGVDACEVGICIPATGCSTQFICDASVPPDLTPVDQAGADLAQVDLMGVDLAVSDATSVGDFAGVDAAGLDATSLDANSSDALYRNVRGSNVGGCTCEMLGTADRRSANGMLLYFSLVSVVGLLFYGRRWFRSRRS